MNDAPQAGRLAGTGQLQQQLHMGFFKSGFGAMQYRHQVDHRIMLLQQRDQ